MERGKIPKFSGDYPDCTAFHDSFKVMVNDQEKLCGVQKLQYLCASVTGEVE